MNFENIANNLNSGCKGHMLNHFGNGHVYMPWTRHDVQIGVSWCYKTSTDNDERLCEHCRLVFFELFVEAVQNYGVCKKCEKQVVEILLENGLKYNNHKQINNAIRKAQLCENCDLSNMPITVTQN